LFPNYGQLNDGPGRRSRVTANLRDWLDGKPRQHHAGRPDLPYRHPAAIRLYSAGMKRRLAGLRRHAECPDVLLFWSRVCESPAVLAERWKEGTRATSHP